MQELQPYNVDGSTLGITNPKDWKGKEWSNRCSNELRRDVLLAKIEDERRI